MEKSISFIHAADLHLDSPFKGLTDIPDHIFSDIRNSTFKALDNLVAVAIKKRVDFVLLVGDLFDNERQSLKAQVYLKKKFETLNDHHINVYISYGNHDHVNGNIYPIDYPENVFIFPNENVSFFTYEKKGQPMARMYGFSYENRAVTTNKASEYKVIDESIPFHIATLHGSLHGSKVHDPYAPFRLSDLQSKVFDYWALGHIHKREVLAQSPPIVYPGNTQGRHRNEAGEKGCYYVTLSEIGAGLEFIPIQAIQFENTIFDLSPYATVIEIGDRLMEMMKKKTSPKLVHVTFLCNQEQYLSLELDNRLDELIEITNDSLLFEKKWSYIYSYQLQIEETETVDIGDYFIGEINQSIDQIALRQVVRDLYQHPTARKHLDSLSESEIIDQASKLLFTELLKVGR